MDGIFFNDIHEEITNAAFGKNGKCFLLIDASLEQYHSSLFLPSILREYKSYPVTFRQDEFPS